MSMRLRACTVAIDALHLRSALNTGAASSLAGWATTAEAASRAAIASFSPIVNWLARRRGVGCSSGSGGAPAASSRGSP
eukprot:CAMPEP_0182881042 /NCGR_PEP_ID=MMETSP0034_2-20130328/16937_1 /TAXON_ID=156128 /ORGANISM="Nephroselmis pyriformis, Strain CCMP717" /LENGTH=78 /DNA_ID=CAMNT_0025014055 /DNA_START=245 /DNA_END=478 /DNA_ORIENTATION=+